MLSLDPFSIAILHNSSLILLMLSLSIDKYRVCSHRNFIWIEINPRKWDVEIPKQRLFNGKMS